MPLRKAPLLPGAHEPEEKCSGQREQPGWKEPGVFTLRIKAMDLPTAPSVPNYLPVPSLTAPTVFTRSASTTWASSLFPEHTCLKATCCFLRCTLNSSLLKHHLPVRPFLIPVYVLQSSLSSSSSVLLPVLPPFDI